jgi:hypothetical protein
MTVDSKSFFEGRRDAILILHVLTVEDSFLSLLAIFWKNLIKDVDPFSQFLGGGRLTSSAIMLKIDWQGEFLTIL